MTPAAWTPDLEAIAQRAVGSYFLPGGDRADLVQEARIGILRGLGDYDADRSPHGHRDGFLALCAVRGVITAVKNATRGKHRPLNYAASLDRDVDLGAQDGTTGGIVALVDVVADPTATDPLEHVLALEALAELGARLATLTPLERTAYLRVELDGEPYLAVGDRRSVDNALQRARHKLRTGQPRPSHPAPVGRPPAPRDRRRCADCHRPWLDTNPDRDDAGPFCGGAARQPGMMPRDGRPDRPAAPSGAAA